MTGCASCGIIRRDKRNVCGRCRLVIYCSKACQVEHWTTHKQLCNQNSTEKSTICSPVIMETTSLTRSGHNGANSTRDEANIAITGTGQSKATTHRKFNQCKSIAMETAQPRHGADEIKVNSVAYMMGLLLNNMTAMSETLVPFAQMEFATVGRGALLLLIRSLYQLTSALNNGYAYELVYVPISVVQTLKYTNGIRLCQEYDPKTQASLIVCVTLANVESAKKHDRCDSVCTGRSIHTLSKLEMVPQTWRSLSMSVELKSTRLLEGLPNRTICCHFCNTPGTLFKKCARCKAVTYCTTTCQRIDWQRHKLSCELLNSSRKKAKQNMKHNLPSEFLDHVMIMS
jgi:hypothetical protein